MASFQKINAATPVSTKPAPSAEDSYWTSFVHLAESKSAGGVTCVEANPSLAHEFLITSGTKISLFDSNENNVRRQIAFLHSPVHSAKFRKDGKLMVVGSEVPNVLLYNLNGDRLRVFKGHSETIRACGFSPDNTHIFSGSQDKSVRYWDVSGGEQVALLTGHTDYVKTGMFNPASPNIIVTGGYDHTIHVWDVRSGSRVCKMNQGVPVESLTVLPDGATVIASGTNSFKVWDLTSGGKLTHTQSNHQKTITSVTYDPIHNRIITGGLDHLVKVYDLPSYSVLHTFAFANPVLASCISSDGDMLGVGQTDRLTVRGRIKNEITEKEGSKQKHFNRGSMRYFLRSLSEPMDTIVVSNRAPKQTRLTPYEKKLKTFDYGEALDLALKTENLTVVIPFLHELHLRDGIKVALSGRDETTLLPILLFLTKYIKNPMHTKFLCEILDIILDLYAPAIEKGSAVATQILKIRHSIETELRAQSHFLPLLGSLELIINSAIATMPIEDMGSPATPMLTTL